VYTYHAPAEPSTTSTAAMKSAKNWRVRFIGGV
jgi:hypothetical protein